MTNPYSGRPADITLPASLSISATTNATPIVATTASPHGLQPGDWFVVTEATDPGANGVWRAGTVTNTTVVLLVPATGANSVGTTGGGAVGSLSPASFGSAYEILSDADKPKALLWNVPYEALGDRTALLLYLIQWAMQIRDGGTLVLRTGSTQFVEANAVISAATGALMQGDWTFDASSIVRLLGRKTLRPRSLLSDANHLINTTEADCFELSKTVGGTINTIRLQTTTPPIPEPNERIELVWPVGTAGNKYQIEREDGTVICQFYGNAALNAVITATFDFDNGVWRLGANPGFDATDVTGVLAGPGA